MYPAIEYPHWESIGPHSVYVTEVRESSPSNSLHDIDLDLQCRLDFLVPSSISKTGTSGWQLKRRATPRNKGKLDVSKLKDSDTVTAYRDEFRTNAEGLLSCSENVENMWSKVKKAFNTTADLVLGYTRNGRQKDWISNDTYKLVDERRKLKPTKKESAAAAKHYNFLCREIKRRCKQDRETYINGICAEVEQAHFQKKSKKVFEGVKKIQQRRTQQVNVIKDKSGNILSNPAEVKERWKEHFCDLYNQANSTDDTVLLEIPDDLGSSLECDSPALTKDEVRWAISCLKMVLG